jgi:hypothetical protein
MLRLDGLGAAGRCSGAAAVLLQCSLLINSYRHAWGLLFNWLQARVALSDVLELLEAAEAKAAYGLAINWQPLQALVTALLERGVLQVGRL